MSSLANERYQAHRRWLSLSPLARGAPRVETQIRARPTTSIVNHVAVVDNFFFFSWMKPKKRRGSTEKNEPWGVCTFFEVAYTQQVPALSVAASPAHPTPYRGKRERKMPLRTWSCHLGLVAALLACHADTSVEGFVCSSTAAVASFSVTPSSHVRRPRKVCTVYRSRD